MNQKVKNKKDCFSYKHFEWYNHFTENVHCKIHGVKQFGFGQTLTCYKYEEL